MSVSAKTDVSRGDLVRAPAVTIFAAFAAFAVAPDSAQAADPYAFCYADPPTYRSGHFVYTRVRLVGSGSIDLSEVANALAETSRQVQGRQVNCWRYPSEQVAEAKRQEGMARDRGRGYVVLESEWQPSRMEGPPHAMPASSVPGAVETPTIIASPVPDAVATPPAPPPTPPSTPPAAGVVADIDRVTGAQASTPAAPDPQAGAVANLNAGVVAAEAARLNAAAQVQAEYQRQLAEHARQVAEVRARNEKAQADYQAAVKACAAGDFSKCGGPPVPVKKN